VKKLVLLAVLSVALLAEEVMVERMQSVVDEVSELRNSYEHSEKKLSTCLNTLETQEKALSKLSRSEGLDYKTYEQNRQEIKKLKEDNQDLAEIKKELKKLKKENQRLTSSARILVDKNQNLLLQVNKYKQNKGKKEENLEPKNDNLTLLAKVEKENKQLKSEINKLKDKQCPMCSPCKKCVPKTVEKACKDKNPFPKLMPKNSEIIPQTEEANLVIEVKKTSVQAKQVKTKKASAYRLKKESVIYDAIEGKTVEVWEKKRSFTSNISQGQWVKITGYFVDKKWKKAKNSLWIKAENTIKR